MTGERTTTVNPEDVKKEILAKYPPKVARKRGKQITPVSSEEAKGQEGRP